MAVAQLCGWLRHLGLPLGSNKTALILRLNGLPALERGGCPDEQKGASEDKSVAGRVAHSVDAVAGNERGENDYNNGAEKICMHFSCEAELLRRERELLKSENELLKRELLLNRFLVTPRAESVKEQATPLSLVRDLLPHFGANSNFEYWSKQVRGVTETYNLTENVTRAVTMKKLQGCIILGYITI